MIRRVLLISALLAFVAVPAFAATTVSVPGKLGSALARVKQRTDIAVYLPDRIPTGRPASQVFGSGTATRHRYDLDLGIGRRCRGANACFLAYFTGEHGANLVYRRKVRLHRGITGGFKPVTCGGSCSPAAVEWRRRGVRYEIQLKDVAEADERATMIRLANQAIDHGPR